MARIYPLLFKLSFMQSNFAETFLLLLILHLKTEFSSGTVKTTVTLYVLSKKAVKTVQGKRQTVYADYAFFAPVSIPVSEVVSFSQQPTRLRRRARKKSRQSTGSWRVSHVTFLTAEVGRRHETSMYGALAHILKKLSTSTHEEKKQEGRTDKDSRRWKRGLSGADRRPETTGSIVDNNVNAPVASQKHTHNRNVSHRHFNFLQRAPTNGATLAERPSFRTQKVWFDCQWESVSAVQLDALRDWLISRQISCEYSGDLACTDISG